MTCKICDRHKAKYLVEFYFNFIEQEIEVCESCANVLKLDRYDKYREIKEIEKNEIMDNQKRI